MYKLMMLASVGSTIGVLDAAVTVHYSSVGVFGSAASVVYWCTS